MSEDAEVQKFHQYLRHLSYPEYALNHIDDAHNNNAKHVLNLSLWNDALPPGVAEVVQRVLPAVVGSYGLAQDPELITSLARKLAVNRDNIIVTAGADDALRIISQYCLRPGMKVLLPLPCFGRYAYHSMIHEAKILYVRFNAYPYELNLTKIYDEIYRKKIDCIYLASPNNPTGHALSRSALQMFIHTVPCTVILDESLLLNLSEETCSTLVNQYQNLFICGSFSKLYGLPGLRIGYLLASRTHARLLRKLVSPFGVDAVGLAIAKYMVTQDDWLHQRIATITNSIAVLQSLDNPMLRITHTSAPVALIDYRGTGGSLYAMLRDQAIATVSSEEFPGLDKTNAVRVIIKDMQDMLKLQSILAGIS